MNRATVTRLYWPLLIAILLIGIAVRIVGIGWGLPGEIRPDEPPFHPDEELTFVQAGKLYTAPDPISFAWGGALYLRSAWAVRKVVEGFGTAEEPVSYRRTLLGLRWLNVVYALAAGLLLAWAGRRLFGAPGGLLAAGFLMLSPGHVLDSHFARADILTTLFVAAAVAAAVKAVVSEDRRFVLLGALFGGLAASTMIWGVVTLPPLLAAWVESTPKERGRFRPGTLAAGCGTVAAGALLGYGIGSFETFLFWDTFRLRWEQSSSAHRGALTLPWVYLGPLSCYAFGTLTVLGALGGIVLALIRRRPAMLTLAAGILVAAVILAPQRGYMQRYVLWFSPFVFLLAASVYCRRYIVIVGVIGLFLAGMTSASQSWNMRGTDARYEVGEFVHRSASKTGDSVGFLASYRGDWTYTPRLPRGSTVPLLELRLFEEFEADAIVKNGPMSLVVTGFAREHAATPSGRRLFALLDGDGPYRILPWRQRPAWGGPRLESRIFPPKPDDLLYVDLEFEIFERK